MQFIVEKQNSETGEPIMERAFSNVELYAGKQMTTSVSSDTSDIKLFVVNSDGNVTAEIQPDKPTYTFDPIPAGDQTAAATNAKVLVDGRYVTFDAYTINQQTYYQIADIALQIAGTPKQFAAVWDGGRGAINLTSGSAHSGVMAAKGSGSKTATVTKAKIYLDGAEIPLTAYTINSHTYYRLKDVAQVFDFGVGWDGASSTITIDTGSRFAL
jgi:archaellum component FlaF (FlaF/FlaG flagellin family)